MLVRVSPRRLQASRGLSTADSAMTPRIMHIGRNGGARSAQAGRAGRQRAGTRRDQEARESSEDNPAASKGRLSITQAAEVRRLAHMRAGYPPDRGARGYHQAMAKTLVIVESPAKAKKIQQYLGADYDVQASAGHIRDLPKNKDEIPERYREHAWSKLGIDIESDFKPLYVVPEDSAPRVKMLKARSKECSKVILATDPDREGEAIAWHLKEALGLKKGSYTRVTFNEITKDAIVKAIQNGQRDIDFDLVQAQEARRVVDRLYGYEVSPVLWRHVSSGLSAGRVQSVVTRMVIERERARMGFKAASFGGLEVTIDQEGTSFTAKLTHLDERRVAGGRDFDPTTGQLKAGAVASEDDEEEAADTSEVTLLSPSLARELASGIEGRALTVASAKRVRFTQKPPPPFVTATLGKECARRFGWSIKETARASQALYEAGVITYIRTDSPGLSEEAISAARAALQAKFGAQAMPADPLGRQYAAKNKDAQEAHEAIRPAGNTFRTPQEMQAAGLSGDGLKLYTLVYERTLASQMNDAVGWRTTLTLEGVSSGHQVRFVAQGRVIEDPGYMSLYQEMQA